MKVAGWFSACVVACATTRSAQAAEPGTAAASLRVGAMLLEQRVGAGRDTAKTTTIADVLQIKQQLGLSYDATRLLQLTASMQWTERLAGGEPTDSRLTALAWDPGINIHLGSAAYVGVAAVLAARTSGEWDLGLGFQPRAGISQKLGAGLSFLAELQLPVALRPSVTFQVTPLVGVSYAFVDPSRNAVKRETKP